MSVISLDEWRKKQEKTLASESQSKASLTWDLLGVTPTESKASASLGFISNQIDEDTFCNKWAITPMGVDFKGELDEILDQIAGSIDPDTLN